MMARNSCFKRNLLPCSDGLTEIVTNEAIAATLAAEPAPEVAAKKLLAQATELGAPDNITLLIVRFEPADADPAVPGDARCRFSLELKGCDRRQ
jgi:serine/threonine protein phosphatase PrpC